MKQLSFFLFVATGLILCATLHAQKYHDAAAFGLKGNVKECKVLDAEGGSERFDPLGFYSLSFSRDGKLTAWNDHKDNFFDVVRSGGLLTGIKQKDVFTEAVTEYRFRYRNGAVVGYYALCNEVSLILGPSQETEVIDIWADKGDGVFYSDIIIYYTISDELSSFIDDQFTRDNPKFYNDETYGGDRSSLDECRILKSDSYGNYVLLDIEDLLGNSLSYRLYGTSTTRIKRIITYWDDEPTSAKPTQAPKSPVTETAPKKTETTSNTSGIKAVDLGLPSGVKWADRNIGASSQKDYGNYYAWGETTPKTTYTWDNYVFGKEGRLKKYNDTDNKLVLDPGDDVVSVELGSSWRMPTEEEMNELKANCTWNLTSVNGVKGFELQSKINGNSIFLPAGGYYNGNQAILKGGSGYYWTSTLDESMPDSSEHLTFDDFSNKQYVFLKDRYIGMTVRPVTKTASTTQEVTKPVQAPVVTRESATARQYCDAAAFGLKGNVKECKVVYAIDGSNAEDPHGFCSLSFSKDGKLEAIEKRSHPDCERRISDIVRSNGLLMGFKSEYESSYGFIYDYDFRFHYNGNELIGFHTRYSFGQKVAHGPGIKGYNVYSFLGSGKDSFKQESFDFKRVSFSDRFEAMIEEGFEQGGNFIPKLKSVAEEIWDIYYDRDYSQTKYIIKTRDSHGNYTLLTDEENGKSIKRIITYWDDEPASNYSITSTAPGIKLSTSKELTLKDLISKPLGVIENPSKSLWGIDPEKVIEYTQENKEWKCTESYGIYSIKEGFNWTFKGYSLDVDVRKYKYVNYSYGYGYYVTMGYKDQETKEAASREMEKLFNIVVQEFRDLGIELTQSQGKSWIRAEKTIGDMHYLVALNKPVEIDGKVLNQEYYVSIGIDKPL